MSGNVWEWTRSLWAAYPYPEAGPPLHKREDPDSDRPRVLRGGAFGSYPRLVRCAFRSYYVPDDRGDGVGCRVVLSPFPLDSEASDL